MTSPPVNTPGPEDHRTRPLSLRINFSWTLGGNIVYAACQWLILVVMAKTGTPEMVGQYALALAIVTPVIAFTNLQLRVLLSTDAARHFAFGDYLAVRLFTALIALTTVATAVGFNDYAITMALIALAVALTKSLDSISDVFYGLLQQRERMDRIAVSLVLHGLLHLTLFTSIILVTQSVFLAVLGMALVSLSVLLLYDRPNARALLASHDHSPGENRNHPVTGLRPRWNAQSFRRIVWLGLPIGLVTALNSLTGNVPRYFIAESLGERELGIFAAMFYLTIAGSMIMGAIADPASPRLAKLFVAGDFAGYRRLLMKLASIALATGAAGFLVALGAGREILTILYRPEYASHMTTFLWLMAATGPMYIASVLGVGVNAMRRFHIQVPLPVVNLAITTALAALLIPKYGLDGAGQVIFFSAVLSMLSTLFILFLCLRSSGATTNTSQRIP
jgi:O-antigen/teichoic acid export membrane protein